MHWQRDAARDNRNETRAQRERESIRNDKVSRNLSCVFAPAIERENLLQRYLHREEPAILSTSKASGVGF